MCSSDLACLGDRVIFDADADGVQDLGEDGIEGVLVRLLDGAGNQLDSQRTDVLGGYHFCNLAAGTYRVAVVGPIGLLTSPRQVAGDPTIDCDIDPASGSTAAVTLVAGEDNRTLDACSHSPLVVAGESVTRLPFTGGKGLRPSIALGTGLVLVGASVALLARRGKRRNHGRPS